MRSPAIGRILAIAVITAFFAWNAVRLIGARPAAEPHCPFPKPAVDTPLATGKSQQTAVLAAAASGVCKPCSSTSKASAP